MSNSITPIVPTVQPTYAQFRGPSNSKDFNDFFRNSYNDIVNAYAALQAQLALTNLTNEVLGNQYLVALTQLAALEARLDAINTNYSSLINSTGVASLVKNFYSTNISYGGFTSYYPVTSPMTGQTRAEVDNLYGQVLPSFSVVPTSKAYVIDLLTNSIVTPANVITTSGSTVTPTIVPFSIEENDITNAVDGDGSTFWRRNVYFPASSQISEVSTVVTLSMPSQYVNNLLCNYVTIHPYPEFGIDITSVILQGVPGSSGQQLLPVDDIGNIIPIAGSGKTRLLFPDTQVLSIEITLRQSVANMVLKPGLQAFILGASVIDFGYITLNQNTSLVLVPFTLSNNFFESVSSVGPTPSGINLNLYYQNNTGDLVGFVVGDDLPAYIKTVYVEVNLNPTVGIFPYLTNIQLDYVPTYTS